MPNSTKRRSDRLELRLTLKAKIMLKRAANIEGKSLSTFLFDKGLEAAAETLAECSHFKLSATQYDAFVTALDSPIKPKPGLTRLLTQPGLLQCCRT